MPTIARFKWYLDPLSPDQLEKKVVKVGSPLTKLSGSARAFYVIADVTIDINYRQLSQVISEVSINTNYFM